ncbi:MAG: PilT/PilU family type 4a pilus ATPase [Gammaproteobacteria bacterium]|nr:PilT/PilU family type 4a pilus ATPase [Gammaproteobacteria bacterium]
MDLLHSLLSRMRRVGASDLLLSTDTPPAFRIDGKLSPRSGDNLTPKHIDQIIASLLADEQRREFLQACEYNLASSFGELGRFRFNLFRQRGNTAVAIRAVPPEVPSMDQLGLPAPLKEVALLRRGLVLFVGACGSGKSTALASMLEHRNHNDSGHIITVEDPIEYLLPHRQCMVNQREVGIDTHSFHQALVNALRQSPDVLVIGEIRTREAMEKAIEFCSTGHLCLSTLHANNANEAFDRIINLFEESEREQILISLAQNTRAVLSQRLIPTPKGGRTAACELLLHSPLVSENIRRNEFVKLKEVMEKSSSNGMCTFDQSLYNLYRSGTISAETALEYADSASNLRLRMKLAAHEDKPVSA